MGTEFQTTLMPPNWYWSLQGSDADAYWVLYPPRCYGDCFAARLKAYGRGTVFQRYDDTTVYVFSEDVGTGSGGKILLERYLVENDLCGWAD